MLKVILTGIVSLSFSYFVFYGDTDIKFEYEGIPFEVIGDALDQEGFTDLMINGSKEDRHNFAHGNATKYGRMPYDVDKYLQSKGWSDEKIHDYGHTTGFSGKYERR